MNGITTNRHEIFMKLLNGSRNVAYQTLGNLDKHITKQTNPITILSYHSVAKDAWRFSVDPTMVKKQVKYLKKHFDIITLADFSLYLAGKKEITKPAVILTFDDGYKDILTLKDFFVKEGITPALFLLANTKNPNWKELATKRAFLNKTEIKQLMKLGWEIGCHSSTHANLAEENAKTLRVEIVDAKATLEKMLDITIPYFAYPRGKYNQTVINVIKKAKFKIAFTMDDGIINRDVDEFRVPRVGVDRTHTFAEFTTAFSPSVIRLRKAIKESPMGKYL